MGRTVGVNKNQQNSTSCLAWVQWVGDFGCCCVTSTLPVRTFTSFYQHSLNSAMNSQSMQQMLGLWPVGHHVNIGPGRMHALLV